MQEGLRLSGKGEAFFYMRHSLIYRSSFPGQRDLKLRSWYCFRMAQSKKGTDSLSLWHPLFSYVLIVFLAYATANVFLLKTRSSFFPAVLPKQQKEAFVPGQAAQKNYFTSIKKFAFHRGQMPLPLAQNSERFAGDEAISSQLPIRLVGTIVHANPQKSVATVHLSQSDETLSFLGQEVINNLAEIVRVERRRLVFKNLSNNRLEYIEIPDDFQPLVSRSSQPRSLRPSDSRASQVFQKTDFKFARSEIQPYLDDLPEVLRQAHVVPHMVNGELQGFRFISIKPNSVFAKLLGFKVNDIIKGVNGEPVTSPQEAIRLYHTLKNESAVKVNLSRSGQEGTFSYSID